MAYRTSIAGVAFVLFILIVASIPTRAVATQGCDFVVHIASIEELPEASAPGDIVRVAWELVDINNCGWPEGMQLVFFDGVRMGGPEEGNLPRPNRGEPLRVRFDVLAPSSEGEHVGIWRLSLGGRVFGPRLIVNLLVVPKVEDFIVPVPADQLPSDGVLVGAVVPETYMVTASEATIIESGDAGSSTVFCADGVVTGGGWLLTGAALGAEVYLSWKTDEGEGWVVSARYPPNLQVGGPVATLRARVICLRNTPGETFTTLSWLAAPGGELAEGSAACPGGSDLTGGGFYLPPDLQLRISGPKFENNGFVDEWELLVFSETTSDKTAIQRAVCLTGVQASNDMEFGSDVNVMPMSQGNIPGYAVATCALGSLVSSGGMGDTGFNYYGSGMAGAGGWIVSGLNPFISEFTMVATVTCLSFP